MSRISASAVQWLGVNWWVQTFDGAHDTAYSNLNYSFNAINGGNGDDAMYGGSYYHNSFDWFVGGNGDDMLNGAGGNDILDGGDGADQFSGGTGNDWMNAGQDNDVDKFYIDAHINQSIGHDRIINFDYGEDRIMNYIAVTGYENRNGDLWLEFGNHGTVLVEDMGSHANAYDIDNIVWF